MLSLCSLLVAPAAVTGCSKTGMQPEYVAQQQKPTQPGTGNGPSVNEERAAAAWEKKLIYHIGPVNLPAQTDAETMLEKPLSMRFQTDESIWITGFIPRVVDENGLELFAETHGSHVADVMLDAWIQPDRMF